jgi:hypothetical protein
MGGSLFPPTGMLLRVRPKDVSKIPTPGLLELIGRAEPSSRAALRAGPVLALALGKTRSGDWELEKREPVTPTEPLRPAL